jgi:hypothetical protein
MYKGFTSVKMTKPERSQFDLSHEKKLSTRMGKLVPVFISETIPNDTFKVSSEIMTRFAPLIAPIMHRVNIFVHYFFVPNRLLWKDWETFITGGRLGTETPPAPPTIAINAVGGRAQSYFAKGKLGDYLGILPMTDAEATAYGNIPLNAMPFAAYQKVYDDYYRDRNYEADNTNLPLASGAQVTNTLIDYLCTMRTRKWQHDYFTSALPWTQRGTEVLMPIAGTGTVSYLATSLIKDSTGATPAANTLAGTGAAGTNLFVGKTGATVSGTTGRIENINSVNITNSDISINELRSALRLQQWLERNAVAGSRYTESIMAHFARRSSDQRLQRAEYLGGGKITAQISEVVNTAYSKDASNATIVPGNMSGHGISYGDTNYFKYNCEEHGFVIGIMSVIPIANYSQGMPRMFKQRNTYLDYPWPTFAHLGEQEVYSYELFTNAANLAATPPVFGYQSRYADWKYIPSSVHGDFRDTLEFWHLARKFSTTPVLGQTFGEFEDTLQNRIFNVTAGTDTLWCYVNNRVKVVRSLPYFGTPVL